MYRWTSVLRPPVIRISLLSAAILQCVLPIFHSFPHKINIKTKWIQIVPIPTWPDYQGKTEVPSSRNLLNQYGHTLYMGESQLNRIQSSLVIMRPMGPWKLPCYIRILIIIQGKKKQSNIKRRDQQNYLVIGRFCYIRPLYEVSL